MLSREVLYRAVKPAPKPYVCGVVVRDGVIVEAAPIARKFVGQPLANYERWLLRLGGTVAECARRELGSAHGDRSDGGALSIGCQGCGVDVGIAAYFKDGGEGPYCCDECAYRFDGEEPCMCRAESEHPGALKDANRSAARVLAERTKWRPRR